MFQENYNKVPSVVRAVTGYDSLVTLSDGQAVHATIKDCDVGVRKLVLQQGYWVRGSKRTKTDLASLGLRHSDPEDAVCEDGLEEGVGDSLLDNTGASDDSLVDPPFCPLTFPPESESDSDPDTGAAAPVS